jgi:hypothetical protein
VLKDTPLRPSGFGIVSAFMRRVRRRPVTATCIDAITEVRRPRFPEKG